MSRKGLTLIELLIMILVIGILSAAFMFSFNEMSVSARASNVINNLQHFKSGVIAWYTNNRDKVTANGYVSGGSFSSKVHATDIMPYLDGNFETENKNIRDSSGCIYSTDDANSRWLIKCRVSDQNIMEKLKARKGFEFKDKDVYIEVLNFSKEQE